MSIQQRIKLAMYRELSWLFLAGRLSYEEWAWQVEQVD